MEMIILLIVAIYLLINTFIAGIYYEADGYMDDFANLIRDLLILILIGLPMFAYFSLETYWREYKNEK